MGRYGLPKRRGLIEVEDLHRDLRWALASRDGSRSMVSGGSGRGGRPNRPL